MNADSTLSYAPRIRSGNTWRDLVGYAFPELVETADTDLIERLRDLLLDGIDDYNESMGARILRISGSALYVDSRYEDYTADAPEYLRRYVLDRM